MPQTVPLTDIVILTVLPEEYESVRRKLENRVSPTLLKPNMYAWILGEIPSRRFGKSYSVALGMTGRAGNVSGALATIEAINTWHPQCVFFVGIAGGFTLDNINKGDIVIADIIYGYEYGKLESKFVPRHDQIFRCDQGIMNNALQFAIEQPAWVKRIEIEHPQQFSPRVVKGNIASGEKVVDDPTNDFFAQVKQGGLKLHAVEMEGAGVAAAIEQVKTLGVDTRFLMVRGISDMPRPESEAEIRGTQERDEWKTFAAEVASTFLVSFVADGFTEPPQNVAQEKTSEAELAKRVSVFGLQDEENKDFGKSEFTYNLGFTNNILQPLSQASRHIIIAAFPTNKLDTTSADVLSTARNMLHLEKWYDHQQGENIPPKYWPHTILRIPTERHAAKNAFVWENTDNFHQTSFVLDRLVIAGTADTMFTSAISFVDTLQDGTPVFLISKILVRCWQLIGLAAQLYQEIRYKGKTLLCIGMVNTLNSHLATFADNWLEPYDSSYWRDAQYYDWSCHSPNMKFCQEVDLMNVKPKIQPEFINSFAKEISLAYNHDVPRCLEKATGLIAERYLKKD